MANRRVPLIPPPLGEHADPRKATEEARAREPHAPYRGKSSGEFQRVVTGQGPDTNALVAEAERSIAELTEDDNYRRLLQLAVLRRDAALLTGLLEVIRLRRR
jgi:hypothetical protein